MKAKAVPIICLPNDEPESESIDDHVAHYHIVISIWKHKDITASGRGVGHRWVAVACMGVFDTYMDAQASFRDAIQSFNSMFGPFVKLDDYDIESSRDGDERRGYVKTRMHIVMV